MEEKVFGRKTKCCAVCTSVAESIETIKPSGDILRNTLLNLYREAYNEGYHQHLRESAKLRGKRERTRLKDWCEQKTHIDDMIHGFKPNLNETK